MNIAPLIKLRVPILWLLFVSISVICYGGYTYWFSKTADPVDPSIILRIPKP
jgi:hypothetical protein